MTQRISVQTSHNGISRDLSLFAGEPLVFDIEERPVGASVVVTMAETTEDPPLLQISGGDSIALNHGLLGALPEGRSCVYNVWLVEGEAQRLLQRGAIRARGSVEPVIDRSAQNETAPQIDGIFEVGEILTLDPGQWIGADALRMAWTRDGVEITGVEGPTYALTSEDEGHLVGARVVADNAFGTAVAEAQGANTVTWAAPQVLGAPAALSLREGEAVSADLAAYFAGEALVLALAPGSAPLPDGVTLASDGQLSGVPTQAGQGGGVVVEATNSGGTASAGIDLLVVPGAMVASLAAPRLLVEGDSVMANRPGTRDMLEAYLGDLVCFPQGYQQAQGGQTAEQILQGLPATLDLVSPGETIVLVGPIGANRSPSSGSVAQITAQMDAIYSQLQAAGAAVVAVPTLPDESSYGNDALKAALADYVRTYPGITVVDTTGFDPYLMKTDQSHPNTLHGAPFLAARVREAIRPLVTGSVLPDAADSGNLLGSDWDFGGDVAASGTGTTGIAPAGWNVSRVLGSDTWTLSRNGAGDLVATITDATARSILRLTRPVSFPGMPGDIYDMLAEIVVDPASTGWQGAAVSFEGAGGANVASTYGTPDARLVVRSSGVPLAETTTSSTARIDVAVAAGGTLSVTFRRAAVYLTSNEAGALRIDGTPSQVGERGSSYLFQPTIMGGVAPFSFDLAAGALPPGLSLDPATGAVSGTLSTAGMYSGIALRVTDADAASATLPPFSIEVTTLGVPQNIALPAISGNAAVGEVLSADSGQWSNAPTGFTYQWLSSGFEMPGETGATYLVDAADDGQTFSVRVVAINASGASAAARSAETAVVVQGGAIAALEPGLNTDPAQLAYSDADRNVAATPAISGMRHVRSADALTGRVYFEVEIDAQVSAVGVATSAMTIYSGGANGVVRTHWTGTLLFNAATNIVMGASFGTGDVVQVAVDSDAGLMWMRKNGTGDWNNSAGADPTSASGGVSIAGMSAPLHAYAALKNNASAGLRFHGTSDRYLHPAPAGFAPVR